MLMQQKRAWFVLGVFTAACFTALVLLLVSGPKVAAAAAGVLGLWGLEPFLFRIRSASGGVVVDERDIEIARQASLVGFVVSYVSVPLSCMIPWVSVYLIKGSETVSVHMMAVPVVVAAILLWVVRAIVLLIQYRGGAGDVEG